MKKIMLVLIVLLLVSCASVTGRNSTVFNEDIPSGSSIFLRKIELKPEHIHADLTDDLYVLIRSFLIENGFVVVNEDSNAAYKLDLFFNSRTWYNQYKPVESVMLSIRVYQNKKLAAYRLYTEDTKKSVNSFSWTFGLIKRNIKIFSSYIGNDE